MEKSLRKPNTCKTFVQIQFNLGKVSEDENIHGVKYFFGRTEYVMCTHRDSACVLLDCRWLAAGGENEKKSIFKY